MGDAMQDRAATNFRSEERIFSIRLHEEDKHCLLMAVEPVTCELLSGRPFPF
jgi:hypothetical protein